VGDRRATARAFADTGALAAIVDIDPWDEAVAPTSGLRRCWWRPISPDPKSADGP
jgi:hypothetical protein